MILQSVVFQTFVLVGAAELFDKTFFIAMLLAMKHRALAPFVFAGSYAALVVHVAMAAVLGYGLSRMVSTRALDFAAAALYLLFALMYAKDWKEASNDSLGALEEAQETVNEATTDYGTEKTNGKTGSTFGLKVLTLAFTSTFIAEFGDRTQFAMIGQHASQPIIPVCIGSAIAFFVICGIAVASGTFLSSLAVSERTVALVGGLSFFVFALVSLYDGLHGDRHAPRDVVTGSFLQATFLRKM